MRAAEWAAVTCFVRHISTCAFVSDRAIDTTAIVFAQIVTAQGASVTGSINSRAFMPWQQFQEILWTHSKNILQQ